MSMAIRGRLKGDVLMHQLVYESMFELLAEKVIHVWS